ncbi:MAG: TonB-dependent receptor plug domain-containing protein [Chitinophagaceae bacterium]|nr:TonB-dependent receptor plug domain-containing protein [Chitinophagaceae bacterium]
MKFKVLFSNPLPKRKKLTQLLLIMKLSAILIFIGCLQVSARTYSQHVTLSSENVPLKVVFREIEKQTGFHFFYRVSLAARFGNIDVHLQNVPLKDAMDLVLKDQPLQYKIINKTIVITQKANGRRVQEPVAPGEDAPAVNVSGTVTNPQGTPLAGASIKIKNTNRGVSTDDRGSYSLNNVPNDAVLVVSYIGFGDQEVRVQGRSVINIVMQPEQSGLNEVVVVGYGTQKKLNLTGAVDQVSGDRLESRPITNVSEGLQGLMANLNVTTTTGGGKPGTTKSINIRGYTGLGTTGEPLILVDGVPADINTVNPNDIESISVLKDAASSAIYGSRAPYGVILITTRQGKRGRHSR